MDPIQKLEKIINHKFESFEIPVRLCINYLEKQFPEYSWAVGQTLKTGGRFTIIKKDDTIVFNSRLIIFNEFYFDLVNFMERTILDEKLNILFENKYKYK